jgi:hypothetical protein
MMQDDVAAGLQQPVRGHEAGATKLRAWAIALGLYVGLALAVTWPLPKLLFSQLPLGSLGDPTVVFFNLWTLEWNADRLLHGFAHYWDAPLFYPSPDAFALSEPQGLTGLVFAPLKLCFGPVAGYNLTLYALLLANACAARRLGRVLGASENAATLFGALVLAMPFVRRELGVLQLCAAYPVLLGLAELRLLASGPDARALVRLGVWMVALIWSCVYYALFFGPCVVLAGLVFFRRGWLRPRMLGAAALALGIVLGGAYPLVSVQARALASYKRSNASIRGGSGSALAYLQYPRDAPLAKLLPEPLLRPPGRRSLYPGALVCALAVLGIARARRQRLQGQRRWLGYAAAAFALMLYVSFGTRLHFGDIHPYTSTAARFVPGFAQLRSPYRAALIVHLIVSSFACVGLDAIAERARGRWRRVLPPLLAAAALLEVSPWSAQTRRFPYEALHEAWIPWLARQPFGSVAMVPPVLGSHAADYEATTIAMLQALRHGHPIVNGYSGFFPERADAIAGFLRRFPQPIAVRALQREHIRYVVLDKRWPNASQPIASRALALAFETPRRRVYVVDQRRQ